MRKNNRGAIKAKQFLGEIGFEEITNLDLDILVSGVGATYIEEPMINSDGTIIRGKSKTLIKINSNIKYIEKKRFTVAHELGHFFLHDTIEIHNENSNTLNWFKNAENQLKKGIEEFEANDFAAELLMPEEIFMKEAKGKKFCPELIKYLSNRFKTSITSTIYRYCSLNLHPIFVVFISNGIVKYWNKSDHLFVTVKENTKLEPPIDSVAQEYIDDNYDFIYHGQDKKQPISKSTWFELRNGESDSKFYEYCVPTKNYKTIVSVIWED